MTHALTLLIKPASGACDHRCRYCFYSDVAEHREAGFRGMMSRETLELVLRRAFETGARQINLAWQGGEPTLAGLDFFEHMALRVKALTPPGVTVTQALQTHGGLLDEYWCRFFKKEGFLIGLSLDGPKEYHDALRLDARGRGTFQSVMRAAALLAQHRVDFNILTVVNGYNARHAAQLYRFFDRSGFRYLQFIPCLEPLDAPDPAPFSLTASAYGRFLTELYRLWEADWRAGRYVSIRHIDNAIRILAGYPSEECGTRGRCSLYTVIEADGTAYPCDFYCLDRYALGNLADSTIEALQHTPAAEAFLAPSLTLPEACQRCPYGFLCRGGCRRHRDIGGVLGDNRFCQGLKAYYEACLPSMSQIARTLR